MIISMILFVRIVKSLENPVKGVLNANVSSNEMRKLNEDVTAAE